MFGVFTDSLMILLIITPIFFLGMKYLVSPVHENYKFYGVSLVTPIPLLCLFFYECIDVAFLAGFTVLVNFYVAWRLMDQNEWDLKYKKKKRTART